jgi:hypothetical protein
MTTNFSSREQLRQAFAVARKVRIGQELFIGQSDEMDAAIDAAMRNGIAVTENGTSRWYETHILINPGNTGSSVYTWKRDQVKAERVLVVREDATKEVQRTHVCYLWVNP